MGEYRRLALGIGLIVAIFLFIQVSAISLVEPFENEQFQPVEDPQNPVNSLFYIAIILVVTGGMLLAFKYEVAGLLRVAIVGAGAWISVYVFDVWLPATITVAGHNGLGIGLAALLGIVLYVYPEWYVVDTAGALMGAAAAGLFGITFGIFPAIVLLSVLAVYDAISVYRTEHMLTLASGVMDLKVPVVLVIPMTTDYSFRDAELPDPAEEENAGALEETSPADSDHEAVDDPQAQEDGDPGATNPKDTDLDDTNLEDDDPTDTVLAGADRDEINLEDADRDEINLDDTDIPDDPSENHGDSDGPLERDALFIGLGDAIIPSILVASATFFAPADVTTALGVPLPAITAGLGTFLGLAVLLRMVIAGRAHAGLPLLNGGSIAGYLGGALVSGIPIVEALGLAPYF